MKKTIDYTALAETIRTELNARHDRSAWDWIHLFHSYRGKVYTAAEIGSIREVSTK